MSFPRRRESRLSFASRIDSGYFLRIRSENSGMTIKRVNPINYDLKNWNLFRISGLALSIFYIALCKAIFLYPPKMEDTIYMIAYLC